MPAMPQLRVLPISWALAWALLTLAALAGAVRWDIAQRRDDFLTDARIAHRLLSQRAAQHEAILNTLVLLSPAAAASAPSADRPETRLVALYPQLLVVMRRLADETWPDLALLASETTSRASRHAAMVRFDGATGQYTLVMAGAPASFALRIDARQMLPWDTWPLARGGPVRVSLVQGDQTIVLQDGERPSTQPLGLTAGFVFAKPLDAAGQRFDLRLQRATGPAEWPWPWLLGMLLLGLAALLALATLRRHRIDKQRAEALRRFDQVARLNTLGELAAGIAHELNQPLSAVLASTQAATRLLADAPPDLPLTQQALAHATAQAQRASQVLTRLRRSVERPDLPMPLQPVDLVGAARELLDLLAPECRRRSVSVRLLAGEPAVWALAEPVALQQITHNLMMNALQALEQVPAPERRLSVQLRTDGAMAKLTVGDSGPGISAQALPHLFEPFFSTRRGDQAQGSGQGLGLGLSLCDSLAQAMGGGLTAANQAAGGALFSLSLPLAADPETR